MSDSDPDQTSSKTGDRRNLAARGAALEALRQVTEKGVALDAALNAQPAWRALEPRDRAFAYASAAAAVRRAGALDHAVARHLKHPLPEDQLRARLILRLAAGELLVLEAAPHAAVDAGVELMGAERETMRYKKLANAVLRKVAADGHEAFAEADPLEDLPVWLAGRWVRNYGEARARAMAEARAGAPPLDLTLNQGEDPAAWAEKLEAEILPGGTLRRPAIGDVTALSGFEAGAWWLQDAAAAIPARLLTPQQGARIADIGAAPGGKTMQLAAARADVIALDRSEKRLKRLEANLARTGLIAEIVTADAAQWRPQAPLDAVLLDAPCTATGTLRRNPDAAFSKSEADIKRLATLQARLLDAAADTLKPGARLVYCTCSLEPEEGEHQIAALLQRRADIRRDPITPDALPGLEDAIDANGAARTTPDMWPERGGLDGFYIARLAKAG
mgnify:CR=1 FL=1